MSFFNPRSTDGNPVLNALLTVIAAFLMPFIEAAKKLTRKVYHGWDGAFRACFGGIFGIGGAIYAGHWTGWTNGLSFFAWLPASMLAWLLVYFYIWPLLYLVVVNPVWKLADALWDLVRKFARTRFESLTLGIIGILRTVCLGCDGLWGTILSKDRKSWFSKLLYAVSYPSILGGSALLGWKIFHLVTALFPAHLAIVPFVAGLAAGLLAFLFVGGTLLQFVEFGKLPFIALSSGIAAVWGLTGQIALVLSALGLSGAAFTWAAYALTFALYTAYVFPLINVILTDGFLTWIVEHIKPLAEKAYDESDKDFRNFFHHSVNLAVAGLLGYFAFAICSTLALGAAVTWGICALVVALSYILTFQCIDHSGGNAIVGGTMSLAAGYFTGAAYHSVGLVFGIWGAIVAGVFSALTFGFVVFPVLYICLRSLTTAIRLSQLGKPLASVYNFFNEGFKKAMRQLEHAYDSCYRDKTGYQELFLHLSNLAAAVAVYFGAAYLSSIQHMGSVMSFAFIGMSVVLSYLLVGKLLFKSGYGTEFIGALAGLAAAGWAGTGVYSAYASWLVAGVVGICARVAVFAFLFPTAYILVRLPAKPLLLAWLRPLLAAIYDFFWAGFMQVWQQFVRAYNALLRLLTPLWVMFVSILDSVRKAYNRLLDRIRGR